VLGAPLLSLAEVLPLGVAVVPVAACEGQDDLVTGTADKSPLITVGECFNETPQSARPGAEVGEGINDPVGCAQPHSDEVFAILALSR
jgi:hypothetical protein